MNTSCTLFKRHFTSDIDDKSPGSGMDFRYARGTCRTAAADRIKYRDVKEANDTFARLRRKPKKKKPLAVYELRRSYAILAVKVR